MPDQCNFHFLLGTYVVRLTWMSLSSNGKAMAANNQYFLLIRSQNWQGPNHSQLCRIMTVAKISLLL